MTTRTLPVASGALAALFMFLCAGTGAVFAAEDAGADGLVGRASDAFDELRVDPEARLSAFTAVHVAPPSVAFRDGWQRDKNRNGEIRVRDRDVARIREDLALLLRETLETAFTDRGLEVAEAPADGVLVVRARIVDLDIVAPDVPTTTRIYTFSESAGQMTLDLLLEDGADGRPILALNDHKSDPWRGFFEWRTRPYNTAVARRMMRGWSKDLLEVLEAERWLANAR